MPEAAKHLGSVLHKQETGVEYERLETEWTSTKLSDTLGHVQRCQHFFKNGSFHIGAS